MSSPPEPQIVTSFQIEDAIEILERRRWWLLLAGTVGLVVGFAVFYFMPRSYTSQTLILVEPQEVPRDYVRTTVNFGVEQRVQTLQHRVTSHNNLSDLIDRIGPEKIDPTGTKSREVLMRSIRNNLRVEVEQNWGRTPSSVFEIFFSNPDPLVCKEVTEAIASLFITENIKDRARQATETANFLDRELERIRQEVVTHEEELRKFREARMGSLPTQLEANLSGLDRTNLQLASNLEAQESIAQRMSLLQRQLAMTGTSVAGGPAAPGELMAALERTRASLLEAESIYTDEHPNVQHLRSEVTRLEAEIEAAPLEPDTSTVSLSRDPTSMALQREIDLAKIELSNRQRQEAQLRIDIAELEQRVEQTPRREQELTELTRDYQNLQETYRTLLAKKYEAVIARNLENAQKGERFKVLRPARIPGAPSFPDIKVFLPAGLGGGLAVALLFIGLSEFRNPAFRSVARLTRMLGLPVFASIPKIDNDRIYEEMPSGDVDPRLVVHTAPESSPAEQYRGFLPIFLDQEDCKVILVTSAARGDGKSLTCMNLAVSLASDLNKRVLVIDGDLRRPTAHRMLRLSRSLGLSNVLRQEKRLDECALNSKIPNLTVLPAGPSVRNPVALLTDQAFFDLLEEAKGKFDIVVIDSPPLLPVVDTRLLRKMADMVLFVVRADATPRDAVVRSLSDMRDVAGVVFNEVSPGSFRRYYYYDAYSRYAYGEAPDTPESEDRDSV